MLPQFLLPETTVREAGTSPDITLSDQQGGTLILPLGITRIIEQESIDISIWGSADGAEWGAKPLVSFPQKFYCGTYQIILDLSSHLDVKFLRLLPAHGSRRRVHPAEGDHLRKNSGDPGPGRHRRADAGWPASRSQNRVVRGSLPQHQGTLSH